ncbi:unnamed protein product [Arctia plantaginis]|uniref:Reverse transcriptase domain-containing protein n=1 Tax=Arctia plantaginis TaxID=874455 RepID=A0A8S1BFC3_ARCPL|nr:unnamed protein product [Arctia plantaginis]
MHLKLKNQPNNTILKITYKRYRNFCNNLLRTIKCDYQRSEFAKYNKNPKKTWEVIKTVTDTNVTRTNAEDLLNAYGNKTTAIHYINSYFANIGNELASKIKPTHRSKPNCLTNPAPLKSMGLVEVDEIEINRVVNSLRTETAVGWYGIHTSVLKSARLYLVPVITHICNLAIRSGTFPRALKRSVVIPIFKNGDKGKVGNYRPISILPALSKILERVLNNYLTDFLDANNIISKNQYGFRKGLSTEDAVASLTQLAVRKIDDKQKCLGIFLDLSKAFDTVSIPILVKKLESVGVRGAALKIYTDYLKDRTQCVRIGSLTSNEVPVLCGVPQGSILGPTLFTIYLNELCDISLPNSHICSYADDTAILVYGKTWAETRISAEQAFSLTVNWLANNLLTLNLEKTTYLTFAINPSSQPAVDSITIKAHTCPINSLKCSCPSLNRTSSTKYLGVTLDHFLNWYEHMQILAARVRKLIYVFKKLRNSADLPILKTIYTSLCESIITYCIPLWGGSAKTRFIDLERAQRAVLKVMLRKPYRYPTNQLYKDAACLTVRQLYVLRACLRRHKTVHITDAASTNIVRRPKPPCPSVKFGTAFGRRNYEYQSANIYNKLHKILNLQHHTKFKVKIKIEQCLHSLDYHDTEKLL